MSELSRPNQLLKATFHRKPKVQMLNLYTRLLRHILFALASSFLFSSLVLAQPAGMRISDIEVEGLQKLSVKEVLATSGLKIGEPFQIESVDVAAKRLADSGLFKQVGYRARTKGNAATIIFKVEEIAGGTSPVTYDNFIWFTEEELAAAIRRDLPAYNGTAPNAGETLNEITRALQKFLKEKEIDGTVAYIPSESAHVFYVTNRNLPICTLHFPGAKNVAEEKLIKRSNEIIGTTYSRTISAEFAVHSLFPLYREVGQLRAKFGQPFGKPDSGEKCRNGVDLSIPVQEGLIYSWDKASWSGNQVLSVPELEAALNMKPAEVANGLKIDKGLGAVRYAYGRKGYLDVRIVTRPEFDDATQRVVYNIQLKEGPQYRMGTLFVKGLRPGLEGIVRDRWPLKMGEVFDEGQFDEFSKEKFREIMERIGADYRTQGKPLPKVSVRFTPDRTNLTVDVTVEIRD